MRLRAEQHVPIADKTMPKAMRKMGIGCSIRRETDRHRYNPHKDIGGRTFENVRGRDFRTAGAGKRPVKDGHGHHTMEFKRA